MKLFGKKDQVVSKKADPSGMLLITNTYVQKDRNARAYVEEGYRQNVVVYRCVREITRAIGMINVYVAKMNTDGTYERDESHPANALLYRPNPTRSWPQFTRALFADYLLMGNMYCASSSSSGAPLELWHQSALGMSVMGGSNGMPIAYKLTGKNGRSIEYRVDQVTGKSQIFHMADYDPTTPFEGMSAMRPAALSADLHNSGLIWNNSLLENGARPSGIVKFSGSVEENALHRLRTFFKKTMQGKHNAGEMPILTDGAEWQEMGNNAKDMDFIAAMKEVAKYIASAFGVPLPLIDNDASSFNNLEQAKERFYTDTVLPLLDEFLECFGAWLFMQYGKSGDGYRLMYDADSIPALEQLHNRKTDRLVKLSGAGMISIDEARQELGWDALGGAASRPMVNGGLVPIDMLEGEETPLDEEQAASKMIAAGFTPDEVFAATGVRLNGKA